MFNLRGLAGIAGLFKYVRDWHRYSRATRIAAPLIDSYPCVADATGVTPFDPHYFFQGAWLARKLAAQRPDGHIDIGSDVLVIGAISAFVDTVFIDYRPFQATVSGLQCRAGNILELPLASDSVVSLSCLHVIEHIGLGRYGDPLNPDGHVQAAAELGRVLAKGGALFLSTPVGRERVCFNAHRVFAPDTVTRLFSGLRLREFSYVDDGGKLHESVDIQAAINCEYGCGLFHFVKE